MLVSYLGLWNTTIRYGLPAPFTTDNAVLADWKNYAMMIFLYWLAYSALSRESEARQLIRICVLIVLFMVWREVMNFSAGASFSYGMRSNGPFWIVGLNANHFGAFMAHYGVLALGLFLFAGAGVWKWIYLSAYVGSLYPLLFSYSRGAYLAALAAASALGALRWRVLIVVVGVLLLSWQSLRSESMVERIQMTESQGGELEESAAERLVMWDLAKNLFVEHPVLGIGFNGYFFASEGLPLRNVHNYYLQVAAENGVVGLCILAWLFWRAMRSGWRLYREGGTDFAKGLGFGFTGCVVAVMCTNLFGDRFTHLSLGSFLFLIWGAVDRVLTLCRAADRPAMDTTLPDDGGSQRPHTVEAKSAPAD
jgi:O-antigen ligase